MQRNSSLKKEALIAAALSARSLTPLLKLGEKLKPARPNALWYPLEILPILSCLECTKPLIRVALCNPIVWRWVESFLNSQIIKKNSLNHIVSIWEHRFFSGRCWKGKCLLAVIRMWNRSELGVPMWWTPYCPSAMVTYPAPRVLHVQGKRTAEKVVSERSWNFCGSSAQLSLKSAALALL